jgi:hypothetical protein
MPGPSQKVNVQTDARHRLKLADWYFSRKNVNPLHTKAKAGDQYQPPSVMALPAMAACDDNRALCWVQPKKAQ